MSRRELTAEEQKLAIEHRDVLLAIRAVIATKSGKVFVKYLFKSLSVAEVPEFGLEGNLLHDRIGVLRAGSSIFKIIAEANFEIAGSLVSEIQKELYAELYAEQNIGSS